jgi:rod shape-determining protein MreD
MRPDLLPISLVFFAVYCNTTDAIIASFAVGFAADLIGPTMGAQMISFGLIGTMLAYLNRIVAIRRMPYQAVTIFVVTFSSGGLAQLLAYIVKAESLSPQLARVLLWTAVYSGIVGPFLFLPMAWWMRISVDRFSRRQRS